VTTTSCSRSSRWEHDRRQGVPEFASRNLGRFRGSDRWGSASSGEARDERAISGTKPSVSCGLTQSWRSRKAPHVRRARERRRSPRGTGARDLDQLLESRLYQDPTPGEAHLSALMIVRPPESAAVGSSSGRSGGVLRALPRRVMGVDVGLVVALQVHRRDASMKGAGWTIRPVCGTISGVQGQLTGETGRSGDPGRASPRNEQLISVPVCIGPPLGVALRIRPETYETAALPLSYVGRSANIVDVFEQQLFPRATWNGQIARFDGHNARIADNCASSDRSRLEPRASLT